MHAKKTFLLIGNNYTTHLKSLLLQILAICFIVAIFGLFFFNFGNLIVKAIEKEGLVRKTQELISYLVNWNSADQTEFSQKILSYIDSISQSLSTIPNFNVKLATAIWSTIIAGYAVYFLVGLSVFPTFFSVNQFMTTNSKPFYLWSVIKKSVDSMRMMALRALINLIMDWCCLFLTLGAYLITFVNLGMTGIIISLLIWAALVSARSAMLAYWLPVNINETSKTRQAFKSGIIYMLDDFWNLFLKSFIVITITSLVAFSIIFLFQPLVVLILTMLLISLSSYVLNCIYFVNYYELKGKPYFVKKVTVTYSDDNA